jgi:hypothetical protein
MGVFKDMDIDNQEQGMQLTFDFADQPNIVRKPTETQRLAKLWVRYANTNKLNPKSKRYSELQHAYLCGIGAVMGENMPPIISICIMSGRDVASIIERTQPR